MRVLGGLLAALLGLVLGRLLYLAAAWLAFRANLPGSPDPWEEEAASTFPRLWRFFLEPATSLAALGLWGKFSGSLLLWAYAPFVGLLLVLTYLDLRYQWLPDLLTLPGLALGLLLALLLPHLSFIQAFLGATVGGAIFQGVRWLYG
ncbi:MAG: prepilin peptidase, partial [Syntrophobacterales bacterium]|nr:prepilin peptidase [Syntrophobacterales bacterium]